MSLVVRFVTVTAVALGLVGFPILLVWPRPLSRVVPRPWRRLAVSRPTLVMGLAAAPVTLLMIGVWSALIVRASSRSSNFGNVTLIIVIVTAIFGSTSAGAMIRAIRVWVVEWCLVDPALLAAAPQAGRSEVPAVAPGGWAPVVWGLDEGLDQRPEQHRRDRALRNAGRWLVAVGGCWYLLGRALQLGRQVTDVPDWWWIVTCLLVVTGTAVWAARRWRWRSQHRSNNPQASLAALQQVADEYNLRVQHPAGEWVRSWAPFAFFPKESVVGEARWPWAASGSVGTTRMLVAVQYARLQNRAGLTELRTRTACIMRLPNARLPDVTISEREAVAPSERRHSIALELEEFNRSLWVSGADARGVYDVVHPRTMALVLRRLPDGARLRTGGDTIAVITDEPVSPEHLRQLASFAHASAQLVPTYLMAQ